MRMRLGAPVLAALAALLWAGQYAAAAHCGAGSYGCSPQPCGDAQCCFPACQAQIKTCYKLVYDTCLEKRWVTCYQTVQETVLKKVCETCYREDCKTCYKPCYETCIKEVCWTEYRTCVETCYKNVTRTVCRPVTTCKTVSRKVRECCTETYCVPGKCKTVWQRTCDECCFDPCTCKSYTKRGHWERCQVQTPPQVCTRQVYKTRTVCEQVPCT